MDTKALIDQHLKAVEYLEAISYFSTKKERNSADAKKYYEYGSHWYAKKSEHNAIISGMAMERMKTRYLRFLTNQTTLTNGTK